MLIPEIHIRNGKILEPGTGKELEPVPLMRKLESVLSTDDEDAVFYLIDLDGMAKNRFDIEVLERLGEEFRIWFKGGFRKAEFLMDALILGAEVAVMDSSTVLSLKELERAVSMSDKISFSIESDRTHAWNGVPEDVRELAPMLNSLNLHSVILHCRDTVPDPSLLNHKKYSHNCGENGFDGEILPYDVILRQRRL